MDGGPLSSRLEMRHPPLPDIKRPARLSISMPAGPSTTAAQAYDSMQDKQLQQDKERFQAYTRQTKALARRLDECLLAESDPMRVISPSPEPAPNRTEQVQRSKKNQRFQQLRHSYEHQSNSLCCFALTSQNRISETRIATEDIGYPNPRLAALLCEILDKFATVFGRYRPMMKTLKAELYQALYENYKEPEELEQPAKFYLELTPYFGIVQGLQDDKARLNREIAKWEAHCDDLQNRLSRLPGTVARILSNSNQRILTEFFGRWREHVSISREQQHTEKMLLGWAGVMIDDAQADFPVAVKRAEARGFTDVGLLLQSNESLDVLNGMSPVDIIMRWVNYHLPHDGPQLSTVTDLAEDMRDCKNYIKLLNAIAPDLCDTKALDIENVNARAANVASNLARLGCGGFVQASHLTSQSPNAIDRHMLVLIDLYRYHPQLAEQNVRIGTSRPLAAERRQLDALVANYRAMLKSDISRDQLSQLIEAYVAFKTSLRESEARSIAMRNCYDRILRRLDQRFRQLIRAQMSVGISIGERDDEAAADTSDQSLYTELDRSRLQDIHKSEGEAEFAALEDQLRSFYISLRQVYRYYARGLGMDSVEWWELCKACRLPNRHLPTAIIDIVFLRANWQSPEEKKQNVDDERIMMPSEFVEALIRLAHHQKTSKGSASLSGEFRAIIEDKIFPNAGKYDDVSGFRAQFNRKGVQDLFRKQAIARKLKAVFAHYADIAYHHPSAKNIHEGVMDLRTFSQLCKECGLTDKHFPVQRVPLIFTNIQVTDDSTTPDDESELVYAEFLEGIAAIACFKNSNPFQPMEMRISDFLTHSFFPSVAHLLPDEPGRRRKKRG